MARKATTRSLALARIVSAARLYTRFPALVGGDAELLENAARTAESRVSQGAGGTASQKAGAKLKAEKEPRPTGDERGLLLGRARRTCGGEPGHRLVGDEAYTPTRTGQVRDCVGGRFIWCGHARRDMWSRARAWRVAATVAGSRTADRLPGAAPLSAKRTGRRLRLERRWAFEL